MDVTISNSVGKNGRNLPDDVIKIQQLLSEVGMAPYSLPHYFLNPQQSWSVMPSLQVCVATPPIDPATIRSIEEFQGLWGGPVDGRVDPGGTTLKRLNATKTPLKLSEIKLAYLNNFGPTLPCGYMVKYTGQIPPSGYKILLGFSSTPVLIQSGNWLKPAELTDFLDITSRKSYCVICNDNLALLLKLIDKKKLWATTPLATLFVTKGCQIISRSNSATIDCPVKPYKGKLRLSLGQNDLGEEAGTPPLLYNGKSDGTGGGAMFHIPAVDGNYYFEFHGKFEVKNERRGFDCTTFVGAVFDVNPNTGMMAGDADTLAQSPVAQKIPFESKSAAEVKAFFDTHKAGTYIVGSGGHVMLVADGVLHEFNLTGGQAGLPGYKHGPVATWPLQGTYFVRKAV